MTKTFVADIVALTPVEEKLPRPELIQRLSVLLTGAEKRLIDDDTLTMGRHPTINDHWVVAGNVWEETK